MLLRIRSSAWYALMVAVLALLCDVTDAQHLRSAEASQMRFISALVNDRAPGCGIEVEAISQPYYLRFVLGLVVRERRIVPVGLSDLRAIGMNNQPSDLVPFTRSVLNARGTTVDLPAFERAEQDVRTVLDSLVSGRSFSVTYTNAKNGSSTTFAFPVAEARSDLASVLQDCITTIDKMARGTPR